MVRVLLDRCFVGLMKLCTPPPEHRIMQLVRCCLSNTSAVKSSRRSTQLGSPDGLLLS